MRNAVGNGTAVVAVRELQLPALVVSAGEAARYAAEEFLTSRRSLHTRAAYERAVRKFLEWCDERALELHTIRPKHVSEYLDGLSSIPKRQQHLAALRHFFDRQVVRYAVILNPALSIRGESEHVVEGKTSETPVREATRLLASIDTSNETVNMIRKGQVRWIPKDDIAGQVAFVAGLFGVAVAA